MISMSAMVQNADNENGAQRCNKHEVEACHQVKDRHLRLLLLMNELQRAFVPRMIAMT